MIQQNISAIKSEYKLIFRNHGVLLVLIFAPLIYAVLYSSAYAKQVATKIPIAVIDNSNSHSSRELIGLFNASPYIDVRYEAEDMFAAKRLLFDGKIYGIVFIPHQYAESEIEKKQRWISAYFDASYFLMYRQVLQGVAGAISSIQTIQPDVRLQTNTLFNPALGYGTFIMPAVLLVILQQTALMGIGMVGAIERRLRRKTTPPTAALLGKFIAYGTIYAPLCAYIFAIHYHIFGYPENGTLWNCLVVMASYMTAVIALAIALSTLFRRVETPLIAIIWSSIPILLLSGASLPTEAFAKWLHTIGLLLPSSSGVPAYIRAQSMGADISELIPELVRLWVLTALYTIVAKYKISERFASPGYPLS